ncbi:hypothetical protein H0H81_010269, partial [Sphagnurus paluster]
MNEPAPNTKASDVYAWSCVCYEIFTGQRPFQGLTDLRIFVLVVNEDARPEKPKVNLWGLTDEIWEIMDNCWKRITPEHPRPSISDVVSQLESMQPQDIRPTGTWKSGLELRGQNQSDVPLTLERLDAILS